MEPAVLYRSDRPFRVWSYTVSHGQLLLRSNPGDGGTTRVEVLFKGVQALALPGAFDTLTISVAPDGATERLDAMGLVPNGRFGIVDLAGTQRGWVAALAVGGREDDEDFAAPTMFDGWEPGPNVRELFSGKLTAT